MKFDRRSFLRTAGAISIGARVVLAESETPDKTDGKPPVSEIRVAQIKVYPEKGNIKANRVEILSTGRVWGDIAVKSFLVDEGGFVRGEIIMEGAEFKPPVTKVPTTPAPKTADVEADEGA